MVFSVLPSSLIDHGFKTWSCGVMVNVLPSCVIDHGFKTWSYGVMFSVLPSCVIDHVFKTWSCGVMVTDVMGISLAQHCTEHQHTFNIRHSMVLL